MPGDFYVEKDCCLLCGVPWHYAPNLFGHDQNGCWVVRQPSTKAEQGQMLTVIEVQELGCIKYQGSDPHVLDVLRKAGWL